MESKCKSRGFTLAELLIVVAIIAVLIIIAIPILNKQLSKAEIATTEANIRAAKATAAADYMIYAENDVIEKNNTKDGFMAFLKSKFSFTLEAHAAGFDSLYGKEETDYVYYNYKGGKLVPKGEVITEVSPVSPNSSKFDMIAVRIDKVNGAVETKPYILISGSSKSVLYDKFSVGDSAIGGGDPPGGGGSSGGEIISYKYGSFSQDYYISELNCRYLIFEDAIIDMEKILNDYPDITKIWVDNPGGHYGYVNFDFYTEPGIAPGVIRYYQDGHYERLY